MEGAYSEEVLDIIKKQDYATYVFACGYNFFRSKKINSEINSQTINNGLIKIFIRNIDKESADKLRKRLDAIEDAQFELMAKAGWYIDKNSCQPIDATESYIKRVDDGYYLICDPEITNIDLYKQSVEFYNKNKDFLKTFHDNLTEVEKIMSGEFYELNKINSLTKDELLLISKQLGYIKLNNVKKR